MCQYTTLGFILFQIIPLLLGLLVVVILAIVIFKTKLNLIWKIVLTILMIILFYQSYFQFLYF